MTTCHVPGCQAHYGCRLRNKGVQTRAGLPGNRRGGRGRYTTDTNCSWEAGVAGERRADGGFMPYLGADLHPIPIKAYGENRHALDNERHRLANTTVPEGSNT